MQMEIFFEGKKLKVTFGLSSFLTSFQRCHFLWVHPSFIKNLLWFYFRFNFIIFSSLEAFFAKVALKVTYFCFVHQLKVRQTRNDFFKPRFLAEVSSEKRTNKFDFTSCRLVFVRFLEEIVDTKRHFEINWHLTFYRWSEIFHFSLFQ